MSRLRKLARDLLGRSDAAVIEPLCGQMELVSCAVHAVREACCASRPASGAMTALEQRGDEQLSAFTRTLTASLTTPIDREDLYRLSRSIDDVLDNLRDFDRELGLYRPPEPRAFLPVIDSIGEATEALRCAIDALGTGVREAASAAREADHAAAQVRHRYEDAIADVLERPADSTSLRQRELLRRLDVVGLRLGEAVNALSDGILKRLD
jgi:hypothetical protein